MTSIAGWMEEFSSSLRSNYIEVSAVMDDLFPVDIDSILKSGINGKLPLTAAKYYALAYQLLSTAYGFAVEKARGRINRNLRRFERRLQEFKRHALTDIVAKSSASNYDFSLIKRLYDDIARGLSENGYRVFRVSFQTINRAMTGPPPLAFKVLFEAGTAIDPVYETPVIPGSSLKGMLRSYVKLSGEHCGIGTLEHDIDLLFGSTEGRGGIVIADARPVGIANDWGTLLEADVTTPIYADGTGSPRLEEHRARPVPVIYPVISRGVIFTTVIGFAGSIPDKCVKAVSKWVAQSLLVGFGGKTSSSYGVSRLTGFTEV